MHPNDPDNLLPSRESQIMIEADAIMAECTDLKAAYEWADNGEALMEDRGNIIVMVCRMMASGHPQEVIERAIGAGMIDFVRRAAMKRAEQEFIP